MGSSVRIDGWPIAEVHYPDIVGVAELQAMEELLAALLERGQAFAVIHHTTSPLDAASRRFLAEHRRMLSERSRPHLRAEALVTRSPLVRAVIPILNWIHPSPHPIRAFPDIEAARTWCESQLAKSMPRAS